MLADGDPEVLTPELFARMTRVERWQIKNYYQRQVFDADRGLPRELGAKDPVVVATRAYMQGLGVVYVLLYANPFLLAGAAAFSFVVGGVETPLTVGGLTACCAIVASIVVVWRLRVRMVRRSLRPISIEPEASSEIGTGPQPAGRADWSSPGTDPRALTAEERGRLIGGWPVVALTWALWFTVRLSVAVPAVVTAATVFVSVATLIAVRRRNRI